VSATIHKSPLLSWPNDPWKEVFPIGREQRKSKRQRQTSNARGLKTSAAAAYLGISPWSLRQLVYRREIPVIRGRHWLFDRNDLDRFIEQSKTERSVRR